MWKALWRRNFCGSAIPISQEPAFENSDTAFEKREGAFKISEAAYFLPRPKLPAEDFGEKKHSPERGCLGTSGGLFNTLLAKACGLLIYLIELWTFLSPALLSVHQKSVILQSNIMR